MNKTYKVLVLLDSVVKALGIVFGAVVVAKAGSVKNVRGGVKIVKQLSAEDGGCVRSICMYQNALTYKAYAERFSERDSLRKIVVMGNSITRHGVREEVGWYSDYGMAASSVDRDFCHQLETGLQGRFSGARVVPANVAAWERNFAIDKDSLLGGVIDDSVDVVIIRLGENVPEDSVGKLDVAMRGLIDYIEEKSDAKIIMTGCFWTSWAKDAKMRMVAAERDIPFVTLDYLDIDANKALNGGDAIDTTGVRYHFDGEFVGTHPNDSGMRGIADALLPLFVERTN